MLGHDWADPSATMNCYRLFAREVIPHFKNRLSAPTRVARLGHGQARRDLRPGRPGDHERHPESHVEETERPTEAAKS